MRVFVSYRHTGVDNAIIESLLAATTEALDKRQIKHNCTYYDVVQDRPERKSPREMMDEGFRMINQADVLLVVQNDAERSEGMLMEVGYCIAKAIPVIVATREGVTKTYLPAMADMAVSWKDFADLRQTIGQLNFKELVGERV